MTYFSNSPEDTISFGRALGEEAAQGDVFCLIGGLGAGKTVFAKGFAQGLGVEAHITSPTFVLVNEYRGRFPFYHFDAYRLEGGGSVCFDFYEYFESGVCLIEWADIIIDIVPENAVFIRIERCDDSPEKRIITVARERDELWF